MTRGMMDVAVWLPETPLIVRLYWPGVAVLAAVKLTVLWSAVGLGRKDAVTPAGRPETDRVTEPVKPYKDWIETKPCPEEPGLIAGLRAVQSKRRCIHRH